jgi:hypothetical protein
MAKKEERGFSYKKRSKDSLKERANMKGGNYDTYIKPKFKQWKPKDGKNLIRILPPTFDLEDAPWQTTEHYGMDIYVNFNIGADNQSYLSLSKHSKGDDPLAEAKREASKEGDKKLAKALNPNQRILYWIIDRNDEDEGPLLWAAPFTFDKSLSNLCIDEDTKEVIFIDDPAKGRDVRFYKEGQGLLTKYDPSKMKVLGESPVCDDEGLEQDWLDFITDNPLPSVLNFYDYDHIQATFDGQAGRDEDDDEDDKPARSKRSRADDDDEKPKARSRSRSRTGDDEDENPPKTRGPRRDQDPADAEDDEPEEKPRSRRRAEPEDDEPDEKPKARSRTRSRSEPEEDDEPEEKPKARSRRQAEPEEDEDPPSTRRTRKSGDEEEGGGSLRERLARRRSRSNDDD